MFVVYVLRSFINGKKYIGYTSKDALQRLKKHNSGCNKWTRAHKPFIVIHTESYPDKTSAIK